MNQATDLGILPPEQWDQLRRCAERFAKACRESHGTDLQQFLPTEKGRLRLLTLVELIKTELEQCWKEQTPIVLEHYLEKFPELKQAPQLWAELLCAEYQARTEFGDKPALADYQRRFPHQFAELQSELKRRSKTDPEIDLYATAAPEPNGPSSDTDPSMTGAPSFTPSTAPTAVVQSFSQPPSAEVGGGYRISSRLGRGSFGEVWKAEAPGGVEVAVKITTRPIDHNEAQTELQALELTKQLRHPHLLQTHAFWIKDDRLTIILELADGSLRDRAKALRAENKPFPPAELVRYFRQAAEALDFLHSRGVQHRDIKPENILLLEGYAKVADFGLARNQGKSSVVMGTVCGTPLYMAPEVWQGKVSRHTDQYSLASAYAELRLGRPLFPANDFLALMKSHLEATPDLSPLSDAEQQALLRALHKDPHQRFASCVEFMAAVEAALGDELRSHRCSTLHLAPGENGPADEATLRDARLRTNAGRGGATAVEVPAPKPRHARAGWVAAGAMALALVVGLSLWLSRPEPPLPAPAPAPPPAAVHVVLPPHCIADGTALDETQPGRPMYKQIAYVLDDGTRIPFVLVPRRPACEELGPFYIMRDKVSVELFRKFAARHPAEVKDHRWESGEAMPDGFVANRDPKQPVLGVSVEDAYRFARWLGGNLPTARQWDTAAGAYEDHPRPGPFEGKWDGKDNTRIAVHREGLGPLPVGAATQDVSPFGCRDMSGNGWEWTRSMIGDRQVPQLKPGQFDRVYLRGRNHYDATPLLFAQLTAPESESYLDPEGWVGFRVVIEP